MNTVNIIGNILQLETIINDVKAVNNAKVSQRELLFHSSMKEVINEYMKVKESISYGNFLTEVFEELREVTEKTSIQDILNIVELSLSTNAIQHDFITYSNAKDVLEMGVTEKTLKGAKSKDIEEYNKNLKTLIKAAKAKAKAKLVKDNAKVVNHLRTKDTLELETLIELARMELQKKKKLGAKPTEMKLAA